MDYQEMARRACDSKRIELVARGVPESVARAAVERAKGAAARKVRPVSREIRDQAYYDILVDELVACGDWSTRELKTRAVVVGS